MIDTNYSNPNKWAEPDGYASLENSKGTTILDKNFVQVYPGIAPQTDLKNVKVELTFKTKSLTFLEIRQNSAI